MRYLLNAAVMAAGAYGTYRFSPLTVEEFQAHCCDPDNIVSRIGYDATADYIEQLLGWRPAICRETSTMQPGDVAFVVRLKYRVDPRKKHLQHPAPDDWELAKIEMIA